MSGSLIGPSVLDALCEMATNAPPGCIVEVGVYKGGSAKRLWEVCEKQGRELFLYDTFEGMPFHGPLDGNHTGKFADTSFEEVRALIPKATLVKGIFPDTLINMPPIGFVHADADQYQSTKDICTLLPPLMVEGGAIWFDDYGCSGCEGCTEAVHEIFGKEKVIITHIGKAVVFV